MSGNTLYASTTSFVKKEDALLLTVLIGFTIFVRLYLLQMINVGPDEIDYWFSAKQLATGGQYPEIMHRTIRWTIILPVAFFQLLLGNHPIWYYLTPVLNSIGQTVLLYAFGRRLYDRGTAFYAVILFTAWPYMWRTGSQIRPAIFSLTCVLGTLYLLFLFLEKERRRFLLISAVMLFLAYQSKITNLYFVPGILILLWRSKRRAAEPLFYAGSLFGLYLAEHIGYWIFTGSRMGRLGIIASHHLTSDFAEALPGGVLGLFARYTEYMEFPWKLLFLIFIASTVYLLAKRKPWAVELTILHASFFFFLTFMVKSIDPIKPVESFLDRYYIVNLPTMSLMIVYALKTLFPDRMVRVFFEKRTAAGISGGIAFLILAVTALPMPSTVIRFYTPLAEMDQHPIPKTFEFMSLMETAVEEQLPIISVDTPKPLDTANRVFYDSPAQGRTMLMMSSIELGSHSIYFLEGQGRPLNPDDPSQKVLWCDRFNFDMRILPIGGIPALADVYGDS